MYNVNLKILLRLQYDVNTITFRCTVFRYDIYLYVICHNVAEISAFIPSFCSTTIITKLIKKARADGTEAINFSICSSLLLQSDLLF